MRRGRGARDLKLMIGVCVLDSHATPVGIFSGRRCSERDTYLPGWRQVAPV